MSLCLQFFISDCTIKFYDHCFGLQRLCKLDSLKTETRIHALMDSSNTVLLKRKIRIRNQSWTLQHVMVVNISCLSPAVFMCTEKHFCSLQWGHQLRRALSITQFPFPAKGNTSQRALYYCAILNYHISPNIRRLPLSQWTI